MSIRNATLNELSQQGPLHIRIWNAMRRARRRVGMYLSQRRDEQIAAALYRELSRLSDAELERRGIARGDLGRHVSNLVRRMD